MLRGDRKLKISSRLSQSISRTITMWRYAAANPARSWYKARQLDCSLFYEGRHRDEIEFEKLEISNSARYKPCLFWPTYRCRATTFCTCRRNCVQYVCSSLILHTCSTVFILLGRFWEYTAWIPSFQRKPGNFFHCPVCLVTLIPIYDRSIWSKIRSGYHSQYGIYSAPWHNRRPDPSHPPSHDWTIKPEDANLSTFMYPPWSATSFNLIKTTNDTGVSVV